MKIYLVQRPIVWENAAENFQAIEDRLDTNPPESGSMVVLAELFAAGTSLSLDKIGEPSDGPSAQFLQRLATKFGILTVGSFPYQPEGGGKALNRLVAYRPDGEQAVCYDKIHPFTYGRESERYTGGDKLPLFEYRGWTICPSVCYDVRFPKMYRQAVLEGGADLLLCIANWPTPRREHWKTLIRARAIENQAVMVAVNRVGTDPYNDYSGDSAIIDAKGVALLDLGNRDDIVGCDIDRQHLQEWRESFPVLQDAKHPFELIPLKQRV